MSSTIQKSLPPVARYTLGIIAASLLGSLLLTLAMRGQPSSIFYHHSRDIGDEIIVRFPNWVSESAARSAFRVEPPIHGQYVWLEEFHELHVVPYTGFAPDAVYRVSTTLTSKFFASLLPIVERKTIKVAAAQPVNAPASSLPRAAAGKRIDINLVTMTLKLVQDGSVVRTIPVAGKGNPARDPTPLGQFQIRSKEGLRQSNISRAWMPWSMRLFEGYLIHEWAYWPNGERVLTKYSLGCIRLYKEDARAVYDWAEIGTSVVIHETPGEALAHTAENLRGENLAREASDERVYMLKHVGQMRFKRHVQTANLADWYPYLAPFWESVRVVSDGTLEAYSESRLVRMMHPRDETTRGIFAVDERGVKHKLRCEGGRDCDSVWSAGNKYPEEVFVVTEDELRYYPLGEDVDYRSDADISSPSA